MSEKLKPCPFCGAKAFMWKTNRHTYIQCDRFTASDTAGHLVQVSERTEKDTIEAWNMRKHEEEDNDKV